MTDKNTLDLARQWAADIDADRETLSQDTIDAAADLISSLPDVIVDGDELRKYISDWREGLATAPRGNYEGEMLDDLEDMLPAPPKPADPRKTLADMAPEERAECQWMQADLKGGRIIIGAIADGGVNYIKQDGKAYWDSLGSGAGEIVPLPNLPRMEWPGNEPGNVQVNRMDGLARTGETSPAETSDNRRSSTARTHPESAAPEAVAEVVRLREELEALRRACIESAEEAERNAEVAYIPDPYVAVEEAERDTADIITRILEGHNDE